MSHENKGTYSSETAGKINLKNLLQLMENAGADTVYIKKLSPNDNSKNQPYFGFHLTDIAFLPTGDVQASSSNSSKTSDPSRKIKYQAPLKLHWIDSDGHTYPAPHAKLIYYPQYPEVRFSGFLRGSPVQLSYWMSPDKRGRAENRWLLLGVAPDETVYGYLATPESELAKDLENTSLTPETSIFSAIPIEVKKAVHDTRNALIDKLYEIYQMGWVHGQKLDNNRKPRPYKAMNGGGYTLEALLGVSPNGFSEPDYLGWEVKQFGVKEFPQKNARPTTLMTPEPNGGIYTTHSAAEFVRRFGYPDTSGKPDRINFGGRHTANKVCERTRLTMQLRGFDTESGLITDATGAIELIDLSGTVAASWSFEKLMNHWKRKHSKAVYVPCLKRKVTNTNPEYRYGSCIELGIGTSFEMFLKAMLKGYVYYDPGIKLELASTGAPKLKRRSQFRVNHKFLSHLYNALEFVEIDPEKRAGETSGLYER